MSSRGNASSNRKAATVNPRRKASDKPMAFKAGDDNRSLFVLSPHIRYRDMARQRLPDKDDKSITHLCWHLANRSLSVLSRLDDY
jgi:hypothetical protein